MADGDVFIVTFRVSKMVESVMPAQASGAYVNCYTCGADYVEAVKKCLAALAKDGLKADEILKPLGTMRAEDWAIHIAQQWPDHASYLPSQSDFQQSMRDDKVIYGPVATY